MRACNMVTWPQGCGVQTGLGGKPCFPGRGFTRKAQLLITPLERFLCPASKEESFKTALLPTHRPRCSHLQLNRVLNLSQSLSPIPIALFYLVHADISSSAWSSACGMYRDISIMESAAGEDSAPLGMQQLLHARLAPADRKENEHWTGTGDVEKLGNCRGCKRRPASMG